MKSPFFVLALALLTTPAFAQKSPNWGTPNANNPNIGIHPAAPAKPSPGAPPATTTATPTTTTARYPLPSNYPAGAVNYSNSPVGTWQFSGWDNAGNYTVTLQYCGNGALYVWSARNGYQTYAYSTTWSLWNGVLYSNYCGWMSQGSFAIEPYQRYMTFYSAYYTGSPVYLTRIN